MSIRHPFGETDIQTIYAAGGTLEIPISCGTTILETQTLTSNCTINLDVDSDIQLGAEILIKCTTNGTETFTFGTGIDAPTITGVAGKTWSQSFIYNGSSFVPEGVHSFTESLTVSFTYTGPTDILPGSNSYIIPVSGITTPYIAGELVSVEFNLTHPDLSELEVYVYEPLGASVQVSDNNTIGANFTNTVFYNSDIQLYPNLDTGTAPYTGTFNELLNGNGSSFDAVFIGASTNGNWSIDITNIGAATGSVTSITLTFAS